jgi:hypothetical protein
MQAPHYMPSMGVMNPPPQQIPPSIQNLFQQGLGITQFQGFQPKLELNVQGQVWRLRRDAADASTKFDFQGVLWQDAGNVPLNDKVQFIYLIGCIPPMPNSLERPSQVMAIGFLPGNHPVQVTPLTVSQADLSRCMVYTADSSMFAQTFAVSYLGLQNPVQHPVQHSGIDPVPLDLSILNPSQNAVQCSTDTVETGGKAKKKGPGES